MVVYVDEALCKGCGLCVYYCPKGVLQISERRNEKGFSVPDVVNPDKCNDCKMCEINCPDFAIYVEKEVA